MSRRAITLTHAVGAHATGERLTYWLNRLVIARLDGVRATVRLDGGPLSVIPLSTHDLRNVALTGVYEPEVASFAGMIVQPGDVVVDVGAHIGLISLLFADLVGPSGVVHSFEPNHDAAELLRSAVAINQFTNRIIVHEAAVGDANGSTQLFEGVQGGTTNSTVPGWTDSTTSRTVPAVTLDHVLLPLVGKPIGLMKIDVEGAEAAVLDGARQLLSSYPPRALIVEVSSRVSATDVLSRLEEHGYRGMQGSALPRHTGAAFGQAGFEYANVCAVLGRGP